MKEIQDKFPGKNPRIHKATYHITTFLTTNSTRTILEFSPVIRSEKQASNQLSFDIEIGILVTGSGTG
jgi:hypothetical protein